jgi:hypothetical protein
MKDELGCPPLLVLIKEKMNLFGAGALLKDPGRAGSRPRLRSSARQSAVEWPGLGWDRVCAYTPAGEPDHLGGGFSMWIFLTVRRLTTHLAATTRTDGGTRLRTRRFG